MAEETKQPAPRRAAERRTQPRYEFCADVEVTDETGVRIEARIGDISQRGCHVHSDRPFSLGSTVNVQITKDRLIFATPARVVSSSAQGMGLAFSEVAQEQLEILEAWLGPLRERDWLVQNRRKTQRVLMRIRVRVSSQPPGTQFDEETHTLAVNASGALLALSAPVSRGQRLKLVNIATNDVAEIVVAHVRHHGNPHEVGVAFILPNPKFWHVVFPPHDWTPSSESVGP